MIARRPIAIGPGDAAPASRSSRPRPGPRSSATKQLKVEWDETSASKDSWKRPSADAQEARDAAGRAVAAQRRRRRRRVRGGARPSRRSTPIHFVSHADLEPQNCTAWFKGDAVEIWAPTQTPQRGRRRWSRRSLGMPKEKVTLHQTRVGGGFGRRLMNDYVCEAAAISKQAGVPVKLQWTREDDMRTTSTAPAVSTPSRRRSTSAGKLVAWSDHFITFIAGRHEAGAAAANSPGRSSRRCCCRTCGSLQTKLPLADPDRTVARAALELDRVRGAELPARVLGRGESRSPASSCSSSWASRAGCSRATEFSLNTGRAAAVIKLAAEKAGWGKPCRRAAGSASRSTSATRAISRKWRRSASTRTRRSRVHKVLVVGDIGPIVNLSGAENQVEGSVVDGFSTALGLQAHVSRTAASRRRTSTRYPLLRIGNAPDGRRALHPDRVPADRLSASRRCRRSRRRSATRSSRPPAIGCARCRSRRRATRFSAERSIAMNVAGPR